MTFKVGVLMGSPNDADKMKPAGETLERFGIEADVRVLSAHRNPTEVAELASGARAGGYAAIIGGAGMAAHLAGAVAAHTTLPVVGVPLSGGALNGVDALYATVQMPQGIPVATVAVDGSMNAALLVVQMLAINDDRLAATLEEHRAAAVGAAGGSVGDGGGVGHGVVLGHEARAAGVQVRPGLRQQLLLLPAHGRAELAPRRTPAASTAHGRQNGGFFGPKEYTMQSWQNSAPHRRHRSIGPIELVTLAATFHPIHSNFQ